MDQQKSLIEFYRRILKDNTKTKLERDIARKKLMELLENAK